MIQPMANVPADHELGDAAPSQVIPLSEHDELEIADGYADVRGWDVRYFSGQSVGYVYDLLVDERRVWYLDVLLDPQFAASETDPRLLIPIERAMFDGSSESVLLRGINLDEARALVPSARQAEAPIAGKPQVEVAKVDIQKPIEDELVTKTVPTAPRDRWAAVEAAAQDMRSHQTPRREPSSATSVGSPSWVEREATDKVTHGRERMQRSTNARSDIAVHRPRGNGRARADVGAQAPIGELFNRLSRDASYLVQQEVALAKLELREVGATLARDGAKIGIAVGLALPGVFALTAFLILGLGDLLDNYWLAALIVGVLFLGIGGVLARNAVADIKRRGLTPEATVETVREDAEWAKREMRELKQTVGS